jgi:hypothetical protein
MKMLEIIKSLIVLEEESEIRNQRNVSNAE